MSENKPPCRDEGADEPRYDYDDEGRGGDDCGRRRPNTAERRAKAARELERLAHEGTRTAPLAAVKKRGLVENFWAGAWCRSLTRFEDYVQRLARGRSYVRNGGLVDLSVAPGEIHAQVSGARLHQVTIRIAPLADEAWQRLVMAVTGRIGSLVELVSGNLAEETLALLVDERYGLFPEPGDIRFSCDCLDDAHMCEHVAAALYGIGVKLDSSPELFFTLRGMHQEDLVRRSSDALQQTSAAHAAALSGRAVEELFGIELDTT